MFVAASAQQPGPRFGAINAVFGQEGVIFAVVGLPIQRSICRPTDIYRAVKAGSDSIGVGKFIFVRCQQLGPGFGAISAVFGKECVIGAVAGLPIECAICNPTYIDRAIEAGSESIGIISAARAKQLGPGLDWFRARSKRDVAGVVSRCRRATQADVHGECTACIACSAQGVNKVGTAALGHSIGRNCNIDRR